MEDGRWKNDNLTSFILHLPSPFMDLRSLPEQLSSFQRINQRRTLIERELKVDLKNTTPIESVIGEAEKKNCEQMFGVVPIPIGYAGPLKVTFSNNQLSEIHLPLATTEGALVASVNRGCKAASASGITITRSTDHGMTRSIAFMAESPPASLDSIVQLLRSNEGKWKAIAEATSHHLKVIGHDIDIQKKYVFLTIACDTDEAMGMNMTTIAAQAIADWALANHPGIGCPTIAGNVDSDKKPSRRTHDRGRGFEVIAETILSTQTITEILKTTPEAMLAVADAKLKAGSTLAGAIGANLHVANIVAALYLATGQDAAHVVEGSLADTAVELLSKQGNSLKIAVRLPAILVGVRGGGTTLPAQSQCLNLLLKNRGGLPLKKQLAESVAAGVLAGEISLLAAQASHELAKAHGRLAR
jgi:hydroxymethylglutaryl-CoA reductase (NADPH)